MYHLSSCYRGIRQMLLVAVATLCVSLWAQTPAGIVRGRVLNETNGEYLEGAFVEVVGTSVRASTDAHGNFVLKEVPFGNQNIRASYLGLGEMTQPVEVSADRAAELRFGFKEDILMLDNVVIKATVTGHSAAVNMQRASKGVRNIVNEDHFGQMNDGNIGMALRRMPGLSVDTDGGTEVPRYVNIRGFDASLNSVTLDGNRLSSTETGSPNQRGGGTAYSGAARAFALDDVPADAITNVEIVKAPTPDLDGDALGGAVNLVTKSAFQREGQTFDYHIGSSYSGLRDKFGYNGALTYSNVFPAFGRERALGISVTASHYSLAEGFDNIDSDYAYVSTSDDALDFSGIRPFDGPVNDYLAPGLQQDRQQSGRLVMSFIEDTEYNNYDIDRKRTGVSASIDLKLSDRTELYFKPTFNTEHRETTDLRHHLIMDSSDSSSPNHGDIATPLNQYVSLYGSFEPQYSAGNYFAFRQAAAALGRAGQEFAPGDSLTVNGNTLVFDPGALVRLGNDPRRISTYRPGSTWLEHGTTYNPDGSARGKVRYEGTFATTDLDLRVFNLGGKTTFSWGEIDYGAYYSNTQKSHEEFQHEYERFGFQWGVKRRPDDVYRTTYVLQNPSQVDRFGVPSQTAVDRFRDLDLEYKTYEVDEDIYGVQGNVRWQIPEMLGWEGDLKTGGKFRSLRRSYDWDEKEWDLSSSFPYADYLFLNPYDPPFDDDNYRIPYTPDARRIYREALPANPQWFSEQFSGNLSDSVVNDYTAQEDTLAGYLMTDLQRGKLNLIAGIRYETTDFSTTGFVLDGGADTIAGVDARTVNPLTVDERSVNPKQATHKRTYDAVLPSVHLRYDFTDRLIGRISVGKTYARPDIKDMVGSTFIEEETSDHDGNPATPEIVTGASADVPNFNLPPQESKNFDVSFEYYTKNSGYYQIGYFRKDMTNYAWSETFTTQDYPGYEGIDVEVSTPIANTDAINQGIELAAYVPLTMLPETLRGFAFAASFTYTDSEALYYTGRVGPTVGHSRYIYNGSLEYRNHRFMARISYQYRSRFFENISISDFAEESEAVAPEHQFLFDDAFMNPGTVDVEFSYKLNQHVSFFANATNIMEKINASRQGYFQQPEDSYPHRRRITFGVKGTF